MVYNLPDSGWNTIILFSRGVVLLELRDKLAETEWKCGTSDNEALVRHVYDYYMDLCFYII